MYPLYTHIFFLKLNLFNLSDYKRLGFVCKNKLFNRIFCFIYKILKTGPSTRPNPTDQPLVPTCQRIWNVLRGIRYRSGVQTAYCVGICILCTWLSTVMPHGGEVLIKEEGIYLDRAFHWKRTSCQIQLFSKK